jgi:hypothetical protein
LGEILAGSRQCQECVVKQVFRYLAGRHEMAADEPPISRALADFQKSGFHFKELLISLVTLVEDYGQHNYASR